MRIGLLTRSYPPDSMEGIPRQRQMLANACVAMGHSVHVFTIATRNEDCLEGDVQVHRIKPDERLFQTPGYSSLILESIALCHAVRKVHTAEPLDILDAPIWSAPGWAVMEQHVLPVVLNLQTTTAQIAALTGINSPEFNDLMAWERRCVKRADGILADSRIALSATDKDYGIPPGTPTTCVYHGMPDIPQTDGTKRSKNQAIEVLMTGRLEKRKGTRILFRALPEVLEKVPPLRIRFVGHDNSAHDGWFAEQQCTYPDHFRQQNPALNDRVLFEGYVPEERLAEFRRQADFAIVPSLYESFGFTYIEAMREGLAVVAFQNDAASEIFPRGENDGALLVPLNDEKALASAIVRLAQDPELRRTLGQAGRARYLAAFQDKHMAEGSVSFYKDVVQQVTRK